MSQTAGHDEDRAAEPPIRVVRGSPTPEEFAALVFVLVRRARPAPAPTPRPVTASRWAASARPGPARRPNGWRDGALPGIHGL